MTLMLPYPGGGLIQHNLPSTPDAGFPGTTVTAHATINTKGSWTQLVATTNFAAHGITIFINNDNNPATRIANLYDIGIGGAGVEQALIPNILNTNASPSIGAKIGFFPIFIPQGSRISARKQSNVTVTAGSVTVFLHGGFNGPPWRTFSGADAIGTNTADSGGVTHTTGSTGTFSTWANLGSTLARQYSALIPFVSTGSDTTMTTAVGHCQIGIASTALFEFYFTTQNSEATGSVVPALPIYGNFAAGTQMMLRATISATADADLEFSLMGLY